MKQWVRKIIDQLEVEWGPGKNGSGHSAGGDAKSISDDRATILFLIDTLNKHLIDLESQPVRKVREVLDEFARSLVQADPLTAEQILFRFRQFYASYRLEEVSYTAKTFDDFRNIVWEMAAELGEDFAFENRQSQELQGAFNGLREAVEAGDIDRLKECSREFIDAYSELNSARESRRQRRFSSMRKNLDDVKKQLDRANRSLKTDHLTGAYNRKSLDEELNNQVTLFGLKPNKVSLLVIDIDHFKKVNDTYGHDVGDTVIQRLTHILQEETREYGSMVFRMGGEEFAALLPELNADEGAEIADQILVRIRETVVETKGHRISFTSSLGVAELSSGESASQWLKRADEALYVSKNSGRNRYTVAAEPPRVPQVA